MWEAFLFSLLAKGFYFIGPAPKGEELSPISCPMPVFQEISAEAHGEEFVMSAGFFCPDLTQILNCHPSGHSAFIFTSVFNIEPIDYDCASFVSVG